MAITAVYVLPTYSESPTQIMAIGLFVIQNNQSVEWVVFPLPATDFDQGPFDSNYPARVGWDEVDGAKLTGQFCQIESLLAVLQSS